MAASLAQDIAQLRPQAFSRASSIYGARLEAAFLHLWHRLPAQDSDMSVYVFDGHSTHKRCLNDRRFRKDRLIRSLIVHGESP